jgi:Flp pilus assembly pilin Flp
MLKLVNSTRIRMKMLAARRDRGATAAEYALIVSIIVVALAISIGALSGAIGAALQAATDAL